MSLKGGYQQKNVYTFEVPVYRHYRKMYTFIFTFYTDNGMYCSYSNLKSALKDVRQFSISLRKDAYEAEVPYGYFTDISDATKFSKVFHNFYKRFQKYAEIDIKWKPEIFYLDQLLDVINSKTSEIRKNIFGLKTTTETNCFGFPSINLEFKHFRKYESTPIKYELVVELIQVENSKKYRLYIKDRAFDKSESSLFDLMCDLKMSLQQVTDLDDEQIKEIQQTIETEMSNEIQKGLFSIGDIEVSNFIADKKKVDAFCKKGNLNLHLALIVKVSKEESQFSIVEGSWLNTELFPSTPIFAYDTKEWAGVLFVSSKSVLTKDDCEKLTASILCKLETKSCFLDNTPLPAFRFKKTFSENESFEIDLVFKKIPVTYEQFDKVDFGITDIFYLLTSDLPLSFYRITSNTNNEIKLAKTKESKSNNSTITFENFKKDFFDLLDADWGFHDDDAISNGDVIYEDFTAALKAYIKDIVAKYFGKSFARDYERKAPPYGAKTDSAMYWKNVAEQLYKKLEKESE